MPGRAGYEYCAWCGFLKYRRGGPRGSRIESGYSSPPCLRGQGARQLVAFSRSPPAAIRQFCYPPVLPQDGPAETHDLAAADVPPSPLCLGRQPGPGKPDHLEGHGGEKERGAEGEGQRRRCQGKKDLINSPCGQHVICLIGAEKSGSGDDLVAENSLRIA